jgi:tetracycline resistance efflux pump
MKKKGIIFLLCAIAIIAVFIGISMNTPGTIDSEVYQPAAYSTIAALLPAVIAIVLALITKEVYSSLFVGIVTGALLYANGNLELAFNTMLFNEDGGMVSKLSSASNVGILVFLVVLGILVALMNAVGGSAAFGQWASQHIKTKVGAQLATIALGILIFVDDYFNCLTVGSVMRPVTDRHKVSRAKLAYIIDATAAPVCIIAPVSSWAAAVTSSVPEGSNINGFAMFLNTIPYNFYALCTILMMVLMVVTKTEYGSMRIHELNADKGDLFTTEARPYGEADKEPVSPRGKVIDLIFPVVVLIVCCIIGMIYTGGFFSGTSFVDAFAGADASEGLVYGSIAALLITFVFYMSRGVMTFKDFTACIPEGFKAMVAPILILTMAWTLSGMTGLLGAKYYVHDIVAASAGSIQMFLPAVVFVIGVLLAFATGTSWGTFSILIPIVCNVFGAESYQMLVISISACLAGAVCGDHCSPISDTTIMASAGAHCDHVNHVSTQLPYAVTAAGVSFVGYIIAGIIGYTSESSVALVSTVIALVLMVVVVLFIKKRETKKV